MPNQPPDRLQYLQNIHALHIEEGSKLVCLHLWTVINTADNQNLDAYIYQKIVIKTKNV